MPDQVGHDVELPDTELSPESIFRKEIFLLSGDNFLPGRSGYSSNNGLTGSRLPSGYSFGMRLKLRMISTSSRRQAKKITQ